MSNNETCPVCDSENITGGQVDTDTGVCWQSVQCDECLSEWQEVYNFSYIDNIKTKEVAG